ncbi:hypothetical protein L2E82_48175 [Cichorium intybus]|uniref:Uncharacterized protein n=1 Tax=Cichorium intybus TaxID=13427 RepID=A0ACB8YXK3_CICIN|nr:hypothetical protein L2E82_48175 [Cichorium intybus]
MPTAYAQLFKSACPRSYTSVFDDPATIYTCHGANYTIRFCPTADSFSTIKPGGQLNSTDKLVSIGGNFTLGFFNEDYSYLGIWYTNDVASRKVWVANRNAPIISSSGAHALSINPNTGDLIIIAEGRTLMSITNVQMGPNANVTATLEDNGNFRLINEIDKRVLWQSFDHPTNVLLPGMKLGYDLTTGQNWNLTSWLSNEIPDLGDFTMSWEPIEEASQRLMIRRVRNRTGYEDNIAAIPMWILTVDGQIINNYNSVWTPEFCYGYDSGNGCVKKSLPQCRRERDKFSKRNGDFVQDMTRSAIDEKSSLSISDCFLKCWNDCSCVGFSNGTINGTGCAIWTGSNSFLDNPLEYERRKRDEYFVELTTSGSFKDVHALEIDGGKGNNLFLFSFASIMSATNDFSVGNKLGQGGFGPVYKAWELWQHGDMLELKDTTLGNTFVVQQFLRTVHVALLCVQESPTDRPTTSDMISMLLNEATLLPTPNRSAFVLGRVESKSTSDESKAKDCSVNNMTITVVEGR